MEKRNLLTLIGAAVLFAGAVGITLSLLVSSHPVQDQPVATGVDDMFGWKYPAVKFPAVGPTGYQIAYSDIRDPGGIPQGLPVRLQIPVIGVDSAIEDALITPDGRMDVPSGSVDVAWFALGPHPGQVGSAVIGGHFGIRNGVPFVFYDLDKLKVGDTIQVIDDKGDTLVFAVWAIKLFDRDADATTVFTSNDGLAHLNLITCEGIWNQVNGTYPQRRVIFSNAVPSETIVIPNFPRSLEADVPVIFHRSLDVGARGADVAALQTVLEQKGLLTMPPGVTKGLYGELTRVAVAKYQRSVGLPAAGFFGPLTRARLISDLSTSPVLPNTGGRVAAIPSNVESSPQSFAQSVKSVFATPMDGFITTLLLTAIGFVIFMIVKRA